MYSFSYDPERILLSIVQQGYWTMAEFRDFERDYLAHHDRIRLAHKNYRVSAQCSAFPVQSAEVGIGFARLFDKLMAQNKGHCAIIPASTLNKMQAKRAIPQANVQVFTDEAEAMAWLFAEGSLAG